MDKVDSKTPGGFKAKALTYIAEQTVSFGLENLTETADNIVNQRIEEEIENK